MKIFSVALSPHDHNTYDGVFHNQRERYTRRKHNIPWHFDSYPSHSESERMNQNDNSAGIEFYNEYFKPELHDILAFTVTVGGLEQIPHHNIEKELILANFLLLSYLSPIFTIICACFNNLQFKIFLSMLVV